MYFPHLISIARDGAPPGVVLNGDKTEERQAPKTGYDSMCSEIGFTQGKSHFHPTFRTPNSSLLFPAALSQNGQIAV